MAEFRQAAIRGDWQITLWGPVGFGFVSGSRYKSGRRIAATGGWKGQMQTFWNKPFEKLSPNPATRGVRKTGIDYCCGGNHSLTALAHLRMCRLRPSLTLGGIAAGRRITWTMTHHWGNSPGTSSNGTTVSFADESPRIQGCSIKFREARWSSPRSYSS